MSAVRVEEAAAVGAPFFDDLLRRNGTLGNRPRSDLVHHGLAVGSDHWLPVGIGFLNLLRLNQLHRVVGLQVLNHSL